MAVPGTVIGGYEVVGRIGAGGMGEVFRARDAALLRDVAIKLLPAAVAADSGRIRRFELEARAAAALSHPNVLVVHGAGMHEGRPYLVSELLEGETLRARLASGALPLRRVAELGTQVARALAAAHEAGIVHRDLKPENLFLVRDGRLKVLDFGLARLTRPEPAPSPAAGADGATVSFAAEQGTEPGSLLGTVGYMSPEQVRGLPVDGRTDVFALGAVLYEMASGRRAFQGATAADTLSAVLRDEVPELGLDGTPGALLLAEVVRRCLAREPGQRFQCASDVALALETVSALEGRSPRPVPARPARVGLLAALAALAGVLAAWLVLRGGSAPAIVPHFERLTFRRGTIVLARFTADAGTVVYGAAWGGEPAAVFWVRRGAGEAAAVNAPPARLLAVSRDGELALGLLGERQHVLARLPLAGGAPREVAEKVMGADWDAQGRLCATLGEQPMRLECPAGTVVYQTSGYIRRFRVSPRGDQVVFAEQRSESEAAVMVVDLAGGPPRVLSEGWASASGVAWHGDEVWFSAFDGTQAIHAVDLRGRRREVLRVPGDAVLQDVAQDGTALVTALHYRSLLRVRDPGGEERDLSWHDSSVLASLSGDGAQVLFDERGVAAPAGRYGVFLRPATGGAALRLGEGRAFALSADGRWAGVLGADRIELLPTGPGQPREVALGGLKPLEAAFASPDGQTVVVAAHAHGAGAAALYLASPGSAPRALPATGVTLPAGPTVSPDGSRALVAGPDRRLQVLSLAEGTLSPLPGAEPGEQPAGFGADGRSVFLWSAGTLPATVVRLQDGRRELLARLAPADRDGVFSLYRVAVSRGGERLAYSFSQGLSDLYLVSGLR